MQTRHWQKLQTLQLTYGEALPLHRNVSVGLSAGILTLIICLRPVNSPDTISKFRIISLWFGANFFIFSSSCKMSGVSGNLKASKVLDAATTILLSLMASIWLMSETKEFSETLNDFVTHSDHENKDLMTFPSCHVECHFAKFWAYDTFQTGCFQFRDEIQFSMTFFPQTSFWPYCMTLVSRPRWCNRQNSTIFYEM